jgi:hypothetical protein
MHDVNPIIHSTEENVEQWIPGTPAWVTEPLFSWLRDIEFRFELHCELTYVALDEKYD